MLTDGLKHRHLWWGGWDIGRRLPFVVISFFVVLSRPSLVLVKQTHHLVFCMYMSCTQLCNILNSISIVHVHDECIIFLTTCNHRYYTEQGLETAHVSHTNVYDYYRAIRVCVNWCDSLKRVAEKAFRPVFCGAFSQVQNSSRVQ